MSCHSFWESIGDAAADFDCLHSSINQILGDPVEIAKRA